MKQLTKISLGLLAIVVLMGSAVFVSAIETDAGLRARISTLRESHVELKAKVDAGTLSPDDARTEWTALINDARNEAEDYFQEKRAQIKTRYEAMAERNPERAEIVKVYFDAMIERHEDRIEQRAELRAQIESGDITRQEANKLRRDFIQQQKEDFKTIKTRLQEQRQQSQRGGFIKLMDVKGESNAHINLQNNSSESSDHSDADIQLEQRNNGKVRPVGFDPTGIKALQAFPDIKADINAAIDVRNNITTQELKARGKDVDKATPLM